MINSLAKRIVLFVFEFRVAQNGSLPLPSLNVSFAFEFGLNSNFGLNSVFDVLFLQGDLFLMEGHFFFSVKDNF